MKQIRLLTSWAKDFDGANVPQFALDYAYLKWEDVTGLFSTNIPPTPNVHIIAATVSDAVYTQLLADPAYAGCILHSDDKPKTDVPPKTDTDALTAALQAKGAKQDVATLIGKPLAGLDRQALAVEVVKWAKTLPKDTGK